MDILDIVLAKKIGGSGVNSDVQDELDKKINKDFGEDNEGKALVVGSDGYVGAGDIISTSKTAVTSEGDNGHVTLGFIDGADQDLGGEVSDINLAIGSLEDLITNEKTSIVGAINEIADGDGSGSMHILEIADYEYAIDTNHDNAHIDFVTLLNMANSNDTVVLDYYGVRYHLNYVDDAKIIFSGATYDDDSAAYKYFTFTANSMSPLIARTPNAIELQKNRVSQINDGNKNSETTYPSTKAVADLVGSLKDDIAHQNNKDANPVAAGKVWTSTSDGAGWADGGGSVAPANGNTDYGTIKGNAAYGYTMSGGQINCYLRSAANYKTDSNSLVVGKGTLDNVLAAPSVWPALSATEQQAALARLGITVDDNGICHFG